MEAGISQKLYFHSLHRCICKKAKNQGIGTYLLNACEEHACTTNKNGICVLTSDGSWIASKALFEKNGYQCVDSSGRFELMVKELVDSRELPFVINWEAQLSSYQGWNLVYSDQCPWNEKSITDLAEVAKDAGIVMKIKKIEHASDAQKAPSGFGVFSLIKDGKLIEDHYISSTRFKNLLKKNT